MDIWPYMAKRLVRIETPRAAPRRNKYEDHDLNKHF